MAVAPRTCRVLALLLASLVVLSACAPAAPTAAPQSGPIIATRAPAKIVRFVFAPDPLMSYMRDTGILATLEEKYNMKLVTTSTWDEFAFFAGGHADIASMGDYEVPPMVTETGEDYVIFGNYNVSRVPIWVKTDSKYQKVSDLKGKKIGVPGPYSSTLIWGVMLKEKEGIDFRVGGGDFELVVNEHSVNGELLRKGEIEAGIIVPEAVLPEIRDGKIRPLYNAGGAWEYYRDEFDSAKKHKGVPSNTFLARKSWYDANADSVQFFLALWEAGVKAWKTKRADIIHLYPGDFGLDPTAATYKQDEAAMTKWLTDHDWFVDTVYMDKAWIDQELKLFDLMKKTGFMKGDMPNPVFAAVQPK